MVSMEEKRIIQGREITPQEFQDALENAKKTIMKAALQEAPSCLDKDGKEEKKEVQNLGKRILHLLRHPAWIQPIMWRNKPSALS